MTHCTRWIALAAVSALLGVTNPAFSKASGSAAIHFHGYTLLDLNPNDGIAPALTFGSYSNSYGVAGVYDYAADLYPFEEVVGNHPFEPLVASAATSHGTANAQVTGGGTFDSASVVASGWIASDGLISNYVIANVLPTSFDFTLTPGTLVTFNAEAALRAHTSEGYNGSIGEFVQTSAGVSVWLDHGGAPETHSLSAYATASGPGETMTFSGDFSLSFANASALEVVGSYVAFSSFYADSAFAIPEPGTWALMLASLGVGLVWQRRRGG